MKFIKKIKNVFIPLKGKILSEIDMNPDDTIFAFEEIENNSKVQLRHYGVCGCIYATQIDPSRQIEFKPRQLEFKPALLQ